MDKLTLKFLIYLEFKIICPFSI